MQFSQPACPARCILIYCIGVNPHLHAVFCSAFAFSSIFRLAARIISSLLRCRLACLSFLSWLQAFPLGCSSVAVVVACPTLEARLYRVIRSGWTGLAGCLVALRAGPPVGVAVLEGGSWKLGGGYGQISERATPVSIHAAGFARDVRRRTCSNDLPPNTVSVTPCTFPPFLCRFQAIVRLSNCGNIWASWSIWAGLGLLFAAEVGVLALAGLNHQRRARTVTARKTRSCGMLRVCSAILSRVWIASAACTERRREKHHRKVSGVFRGDYGGCR